MSQETLQPYSELAQSVQANSLYEHYKGMRYKVLAVGRHSETLEELIIYQALYGDFGVWVRPLKMFFEVVEIKGAMTPRFRFVGHAT